MPHHHTEFVKLITYVEMRVGTLQYLINTDSAIIANIYIIIINNMYDSQAVTFTRVSRIGGGGDAPEITNPNLSSKYLSQLY